MKKEQIYNVLDNMMVNHKSIKFINHLVKSYLPSKKICVVNGLNNDKLKCLFTDEDLVTLDDLLKNVNSDSQKEVVNQIITSITKNKELDGYDLNILMTNSGKSLAISGDQTNTYMSIHSYLYFFEWVREKLNEGNKHINWLIGSDKNSIFGNTIKPKPKKTVEFDANSAKYKLGEACDVLIKLKEKMDGKF